MQLLDSAGRKTVLWAGKKAIESNKSAWLFIVVIRCVSSKCPESTSYVSLIKLVSHKEERTQKLLEESGELLLWCSYRGNCIAGNLMPTFEQFKIRQ